jgi:uncharacterized integral membrane protein
MDAKKITGFALLGLVGLVLIFNVGWTDGVTVDLLVTKLHAAKSVVILASVAIGVTIGALLR